MTEIWAEWKNGKKEKVDTADCESEAIYLTNKYRIAYGEAAKKVWIKSGKNIKY